MNTRFRNDHPFSRSLHFGHSVFRFPALSASHRTSLRNVKPLAAAQGFSAEVTTGSRPGFVNRTDPFLNSTAIRLLFTQVLTGCIDKEITAFFFKPPLAEVMQLVGFTLPDKDNREPAAALATLAAGSGRGGLGGFHNSISLYRAGTNSVR